MKTALLLTSISTAVRGPAFLIPIAILAFRTQQFPPWLAWFTVACAIGSFTPIGGAFALTGPMNVGNGLIGIHTVAASWVEWRSVVSLYFLRIHNSFTAAEK